MTKGLMIAAPRSGSGKTTVTLGLLRALARRGVKVGSFKCGPDYIDPAFHTIATGRTSLNLDSWVMNEAMLDANFAQGSTGADFVIVEGSMGLFDGVAMRGASGDGSSSDIAARFGLPVVLIMDVSGQSQSAGATAMGFRNFHPDVHIAGVILGNVASERHRLLATKGIERTGLPVLGALPRGGVPAIPERHLGLVQAEEIPGVIGMVDALADAMEQLLDIDAIISLPHRGRAGVGASTERLEQVCPPPNLPPIGGGIALASDAAFSFTYAHMLELWRASGVTILPFSPLANEAPSLEADLCWLPGGYPELHAQKIAENRSFLQGLRDFAQTKPVHGECGGYMVLGEKIIDADGKSWDMAGLLPVTTSFAKRKLHLGYRALRLNADGPMGQKGTLARGHEFHYASIVERGSAEPLGSVTDANGTALGDIGQRVGNVTGSFFHMVANNG